MTVMVGGVRPDARFRHLLSACGESLKLCELAGAREALQWIEDNVEQADLLVLGPDVEKPVQLAARALAVSSKLEVMLCTDAAERAQRTAEIGGSPLLGRAACCLVLDDPDGASVALSNAVSRAERRRRHSLVIAASQARLQAHQSRVFKRPYHFVEKLWEHLPLAVVVTDAPDARRDDGVLGRRMLECKIFECNDRASAMLAPGGQAGALLGRRFVECFPEVEWDEVAALLSDARSTDPKPRSFTVGRGGESRRHVEALAVYLHAEDCLLILVQDVTERRRAEEEQQRQWSLIASQQAEIETLSTPIIQVW
jgi:hypothetical protein